jgi:hypothetical protein
MIKIAGSRSVVRGTDPRFRIRVKMSRIGNTATHHTFFDLLTLVHVIPELVKKFREFNSDIHFWPILIQIICKINNTVASVLCRLVVMAAVAAVWGLRLTYNFYRRGGYAWPPWTGEEDYRSVRSRS